MMLWYIVRFSHATESLWRIKEGDSQKDVSGVTYLLVVQRNYLQEMFLESCRIGKFEFVSDNDTVRYVFSDTRPHDNAIT